MRKLFRFSEKSKMADLSMASLAQTKRSSNWSDVETTSLIYVWRENINDLRSQKRNSYIFAKISEDLKLMNIHRDAKSCKTKIKNLERDYRSEKAKLHSGASPSTWKFYTDVHAIIGAFPSNDNNLMEESMSLNTETCDEVLNEAEEIICPDTVQQAYNLPTGNSTADCGSISGETDFENLVDTSSTSPREANKTKKMKRKKNFQEERISMMQNIVQQQKVFLQAAEETDKKIIHLLEQSNKLHEVDSETSIKMCNIFESLSDYLRK